MADWVVLILRLYRDTPPAMQIDGMAEPASGGVAVDDDTARLRALVESLMQDGAARIPSEARLSEHLQISRGRLRTLLRKLEEEGLIWRHVGKGTFLGPRLIGASSPIWAQGISVDDIMDARIVLEPQLAAQAAIHARPSDIAAMDRCLSEMKTAPSYGHWKRLDERLHRTVAEAAHNSLLLLIYDTLRIQIKESLDIPLEKAFADHAKPDVTDDQHESLIQAIRSHDAGLAESAMRDHLRSVRNRLFGLR